MAGGAQFFAEAALPTYLGGNNLEDIPDELLYCQSLAHLLLGNNKISDFPENMFSMRELKVLNPRGNYVSNMAVTEMFKCDTVESSSY